MKYEVIIKNPAGLMVSTMTTGPKGVQQFCLPVARRHAADCVRIWGWNVEVQPVGGWVEVRLVREFIEVPTTTRYGRPSYRRTNGYYVTTPEGNKIYPPMLRNEAIVAAREFGGPATKIVFGE